MILYPKFGAVIIDLIHVYILQHQCDSLVYVFSVWNLVMLLLKAFVCICFHTYKIRALKLESFMLTSIDFVQNIIYTKGNFLSKSPPNELFEAAFNPMLNIFKQQHPEIKRLNVIVRFNYLNSGTKCVIFFCVKLNLD